MSSKRTAGRSAPAATVAGPGSGSALTNALLMAGAIAMSMAILVARGHMSWPPNQLLSSVFTVAGCLALVGPIVMARVDSGERSLGELLWMTGGLLIWVFDIVGIVRGQWRTIAWATPINAQTMGLTILAVLLAGWRCRFVGKSWSWTNVTGWLLGLYWVGMAISTFLPERTLLSAVR